MVTVFSYIHNFNQGVFSTTNSTIRVANLFKKSSTTNPDGVHLLYKYIRWQDAPYLQSILLKNWSAEALATKYWPGISANWTEIGDLGYEGTILKDYNFPVFFRDYIFFCASTYTDAIYYAKLNTKKTETKEVKVAIRTSEMPFYSLGWLYIDNIDPDYGYKMVTYKQDGGQGGSIGVYPFDINYSENLVQYKANSLEGPWVYDKTWNTFIPDYGSPEYIAIIQELASLILSKTHKNLSVAVHYTGANWGFSEIIIEVYDPPYTANNHGAWVFSRGNEGEIVGIFEGQPSAKNYLIKRQGNGQMSKTLITDIDQGFKD